MKTNKTKINYADNLLSTQLARGRQLVFEGKYDLAEMMKNWGHITSPYIYYDPATDSLKYAYKHSRHGIVDAETEAANCWATKNIIFFPLVFVNGWKNGPGENIDQVPDHLWGPDEQEVIASRYQGDYEAYLADNPGQPSYRDRCVNFIVSDLDSCRAKHEFYKYYLRGLRWLENKEDEEGAEHYAKALELLSELGAEETFARLMRIRTTGEAAVKYDPKSKSLVFYEDFDVDDEENLFELWRNDFEWDDEDWDDEYEDFSDEKAYDRLLARFKLIWSDKIAELEGKASH